LVRSRWAHPSSVGIGLGAKGKRTKPAAPVAEVKSAPAVTTAAPAAYAARGTPESSRSIRVAIAPAATARRSQASSQNLKTVFIRSAIVTISVPTPIAPATKASAAVAFVPGSSLRAHAASPSSATAANAPLAGERRSASASTTTAPPAATSAASRAARRRATTAASAGASRNQSAPK
jgi:hypothetical protein